jgi:putative tricarboxylic transport membrane protein
MRRIGAPTDLAAGLFFIAVAGMGFWLLRDVRLGTTTRMGPGFLPTAICAILLLVGLVLAARSVLTAGPPLERWYLRPLAAVLGALYLFSLGVERLGLFVTIVLIVAVAAFATPESRWKEVAVTALALAAFSTALFVWALGLPIPAWPPVF